MRVLFLLKLGSAYGYGSGYGRHESSGLYNSTLQCVEMLKRHGIDAKLVQVVDNNDIDRETYNFKPDVVVIEALWVVPSKFEELGPLHPSVKWIVRIHSKIPFLANEGIANEWIFEYVQRRNVYVAFNDPETAFDYGKLVTCPTRILSLPNVYRPEIIKSGPRAKGKLRVACFGAIRPLKNQLLQASVAILTANRLGSVLEFHINATRVEQQGENVLKNLRALFENSKPHRLIEHDWMKTEDFKDVLRSLDIGMQVSLSETFNFVSADTVSAGVPIVVSSEIPWAVSESVTEPTSSFEIEATMLTAWNRSKDNVADNLASLINYSRHSEKMWLKTLKEIL